MSRTTLIETLMAKIGMDTTDLVANLKKGTADYLAGLNVKSSEVKDVYETAAVVEKIGQELEVKLFAALMTSELTIEELEDLHKFMDSQVGEKWKEVRLEIRAVSDGALRKICEAVGKHYAHTMYVKLTKMLTLFANDLCPDMKLDEAIARTMKFIGENSVLPIIAPGMETEGAAKEAAEKLVNTFNQSKDHIEKNKEHMNKMRPIEIIVEPTEVKTCTAKKHGWYF